MATLRGVPRHPDAGLSPAERTSFSISESAQLLGVSRVTIWRWIRRGYLPVARLGHRTTRIARADLERLPERMRELTSWPANSPVDASAEHWVQFYESDDVLLEAASQFVATGLATGQAALVIATPDHRQQLRQRLGAHGFDLDALATTRRYLALDADATLQSVLRAGLPDPEQFGAAIGQAFGQLAAECPSPRVYGEMVALLAAEHNQVGLIQLEQLWNVHQRTHPFSLMCGYPLGAFADDGGGEAMAEICAQHGHVVPSQALAFLAEADQQVRTLAGLQHEAAWLRAELLEHQRTAAALQAALDAEREARQVAEQALRSRDEFVAVASHELKTPLTTLSSQVQLALRRLSRDPQLDPQRVQAMLETIRGQTDKLGRLLNQLLDLSRLEAGKLVLEPQPLDFAGLVARVVAEAQQRTEQHTLELQAPTTLLVSVDAVRLEQVLTNLLDNAIKYSPGGGPVQVQLAATDSAVELSVRDFGPGIPEALRPRIFERFYQAHTGDGRGGLGLGLYISHQIVERHGGTLGAEFPSDGGSRFVVRLPN